MDELLIFCVRSADVWRRAPQVRLHNPEKLDFFVKNAGKFFYYFINSLLHSRFSTQ